MVAMESAFAICACFAVPALGELVEVDEGGFVSTHVIEVDAPPARVFAALTVETGSPDEGGRAP